MTEVMLILFGIAAMLGIAIVVTRWLKGTIRSAIDEAWRRGYTDGARRDDRAD